MCASNESLVPLHLVALGLYLRVVGWPWLYGPIVLESVWRYLKKLVGGVVPLHLVVLRVYLRVVGWS